MTLWDTGVHRNIIHFYRGLTLYCSWGNKLVLLDSTKGLLKTDKDGFVVG